MSFRARRLCGLLLAAAAAMPAMAQAPAAASAAFDDYVRGVESRLAQQHASAAGFLAGGLAPDTRRQLRQQELIIDRVADRPQEELPGALLHHWRGTAFAPGATAAGFEAMMRDLSVFPRIYAPEVLAATVRERHGEQMLATMRVRQKHVIIVVLDVTYDSSFHHLDAAHAYSIAHSTRIEEIGSPGAAGEQALPPAEEHGFLWRLNTYWTFEEADGGLYMQIESVSLTRSIPRGLGWMVRPFTDSIPRESLEFTLGATRKALSR